MTKKFTVVTDIVEQYEGWLKWYNPIDVSVVAESECENPTCGWKGGLNFKGFQQGASRIAIAICPKCGHQFEF